MLDFLAAIVALAVIPASADAFIPLPLFYHQKSIQAGDTLTGSDTAEKGPFASNGTVPCAVLAGFAVSISELGSGSALPGGGTITFRLKFGATVLWTSQAYTVDNTVWYLDGNVRCETAGASGTAVVTVRHGVGPGVSNFVGSSGVSTTVSSVDWTAASVVGIFCQWSVGNAGHTAVQKTCDISYYF